jgi:serine/threonine protein phosphatase PrpC
VPDTAASADARTIALNGGDHLQLSWAAITHQGMRRDLNQDAILTAFPLFIVADGMGGHLGGEIASASTVDRLGAMAREGKVTPKLIERALSRAVKDIVAHPQATDDGTGTTVTGVFLDNSAGEPNWVTLNIGDSRVYLLREGSLVQITTDHSVVQELVAAGRLSPEEAENHPYGNVITRAVGPSESVQPDYVRLDVLDGDRFVICSDGLTKELTDYGIRHFLFEHVDPAGAVEAMLHASLENGGRDNISIIVVDVHRSGRHGTEPDDDTDTARRGPARRPPAGDSSPAAATED